MHHDVFRNIVSIRASQDLFDDLSNDPADWALAQHAEAQSKPYAYRSKVPIVDRPFEEAEWLSAIRWPFEHWQHSRYSDGSFGLWYGAGSAETTVYETAFHWFTGLLQDAGFDQPSSPVVAERKLYSVACDAALIDVRPQIQNFPQLVHPSDYLLTQSLGARLHREGHPGLITASVRDVEHGSVGDCYVVLNAKILSNPRHLCQATYRLDQGRIFIEKQIGVSWITISTSNW